MVVLGSKSESRGTSKLYSATRRFVRGSVANVRLKVRKDHKKHFALFTLLIGYYSSTVLWKKLQRREGQYTSTHPLKQPDTVPRAFSSVFLFCDPSNRCCHDFVHHSLSSLRDQTLVPYSVTVFHDCPVNDADFSNAIDQYSKDFDLLRKVKCEFNNVRHCILSSIYEAKKGSNPSTQLQYLLILKSSSILHPNALEKSLLYTELRPKLSGVKLLGALAKEGNLENMIHENFSLPNESISFLPLLLNVKRLNSLNLSINNGPIGGKDTTTEEQLDMLRILKNSRLIREPLYSQPENSVDSKLSIQSNNFELWDRARKLSLDLAYLYSDEAYFHWSVRKESTERFRDSHQETEEEETVDVGKISEVTELKRGFNPSTESIMFFVPFLQMGGSEKCILNLANHAISTGLEVSIVLTMPLWAVDSLGEIHAKNEWMSRALEITPHVFDLVQTGTYDHFAKLLRYFVESRKPEYIFVANSAATYEYLEFINLVSPGSLIVDYNHMMHWNWEPKPGFGTGGLPRYGTYFTKYIHNHFTASNNVSGFMKTWIESAPGGNDPNKVKTCYIGTEVAGQNTSENSAKVREQERSRLGISNEKIVILFVGRFVRDKGVDILSKSLKIIASNAVASRKICFLFVGSGQLEQELLRTKRQIENSDLQVILEPPSTDSEQLRTLYATADILLLPSRNEGIALVIYEAMASGLFVMSTDVGGQAEILNSKTGELLPIMDTMSHPEKWLAEKTINVTTVFGNKNGIREYAKNLVRTNYTTANFCNCIFDTMQENRRSLQLKRSEESIEESKIEAMSKQLVSVVHWQKADSQWNMDQIRRPIESLATIGIKTYVCDTSITKQLLHLLRSIRLIYPTVKILVANDGPLRISGVDMIKNDDNIEEVVLQNDAGISYGRNLMVSLTKTEYFVLLDDDHLFDYQTDLEKAIAGLKKGRFDIVGFRVLNLPGIFEMETESIFIPRYVALVSEFKDRKVKLCVWNENNGPGVSGMKYPIKVDVLHNSLIARTDILQDYPWRNELKVNEHLTFFLDARRKGLKVGYLPSVFVHHQARQYSTCYKAVRFREDKYEVLLDYEDKLLWDVECGNEFPNRVRRHLNETSLL